MSSDEIVTLLDELGRRLGPAGQHVLELGTRQIITSSIVWIITAIAVVIACFLGIRWGWRAWNNSEDIGGPILMTFGGFGIATSVIVIATSLIALLNPEWSALTQILTTLKH